MKKFITVGIGDAAVFHWPRHSRTSGIDADAVAYDIPDLFSADFGCCFFTFSYKIKSRAFVSFFC
jgi:hypothetical protein